MPIKLEIRILCHCQPPFEKTFSIVAIWLQVNEDFINVNFTQYGHSKWTYELLCCPDSCDSSRPDQPTDGCLLCCSYSGSLGTVHELSLGGPSNTELRAQNPRPLHWSSCPHSKVRQLRF